MVGVVSWDLEKSQASLKDEHKAVAMQNREVHELARRTIKEHEDHEGFDTTVDVVDRVPELMTKTRADLAKTNTEVQVQYRQPDNYHAKISLTKNRNSRDFPKSKIYVAWTSVPRSW